MENLDRTEVAQLPPREEQLVDFPVFISQASVIYRAKQRKYGAWHFSSVPLDVSDAGGRFHLQGPRGTCYWADSDVAALREVIGPYVMKFGAVTDARLALLSVARSFTPSGGRFAHVTHAKAASHGVIKELCTMGDYSIPQRWAAGFDQHGLDGVRYSTRFTSEGKDNAWAFFGDASSDGSDRFESEATTPLEICARAGIRVVAVPSSGTPSTILSAAEIPAGAMSGQPDDVPEGTFTEGRLIRIVRAIISVWQK